MRTISRLTYSAYACSILLSAFLNFFIQPLLAKYLQPMVGGSALIWLSCLLFFQGMLFIGHAYAYLLTNFFSTKQQLRIHTLLLIVALLSLPFDFNTLAIEQASLSPLSIYYLLSKHLFLSMLIVSSTNPIIQFWYQRQENTSPYQFYALSNFGSLIGLFCYPLLFEVWFAVPQQFYLWYLAFLILYIALAIVIQTSNIEPFHNKTTSDVVIHSNHALQSFMKPLLWVIMACLSCALMMSTTNYIAQNVLNIPLAWIIPLALFLISYIVVFSKQHPVDDHLWAEFFILWLVVINILMALIYINTIDMVIALYVLLFSGCMLCHNTLFRLKPQADKLPAFYLAIAFGGVIGGCLVNSFAFSHINGWWDWITSVLLVSLLSIIFLVRAYQQQRSAWRRRMLAAAVIAFPSFFICSNVDLSNLWLKQIYATRSPYGNISVYEDVGNYRELRHGTIVHGVQSTSRPLLATSYYSRQSGVAAALFYLQNKHPKIQIAAIGLGIGTIASYGRSSDKIDFFEIDPSVVAISQNYFSFLSSSQSDHSITIADGRIGIAKQIHEHPDRKYDLIIVDAFSGDNIPFHLLTKEAFKIYNQALNSDGVIALHTSNIYTDLSRVTLGLAKYMQLHHYWIHNEAVSTEFQFQADWILLSGDSHLGNWLHSNNYSTQRLEDRKALLWTDHLNSVLPLLRIKT